MGVSRAETGHDSGVIIERAETDLEPGVYGLKEIAPVALRDLVILSQVRNVPNPEADAIKESIRSGELINQIDVARLDRLAFEEYVAFVNEVWGDDFDPANFPAADDGFTYLVVAGHTRAEAMIAIEDEKLLERGRLGLPLPDEVPVTYAKIKTNMTPDDIIALQLNENLHRQPPQERSAMGIVETYFFGLKNGKWSNKAEFLRLDGKKFSRSTLNDALNFAELPSHIRDFVLAGGIPYRAGVELGKTLPVFREYVMHKYFAGRSPMDMPPDQIAEYENGILEWMGAEVAHVQQARQKGKFSGAVIKGRYESYRQEFERFVRQATGQEEDSQLGFEMADTMADWRLRRRRLRDEYKMRVRELGAEPLGRMATLFSLHGDLLKKTAVDDREDMSELVETVERHYVQAVKSMASEPVPAEGLF